jgi:hypothetical protein
VRLLADGGDLDLLADAQVDLAEVLTQAEGRESGGPPLQEALDLYEQKGNSVAADRVRLQLAELQPV